MAFTEFCCRSGGSNLNAGTRTGSSTEPGTSADLTYAAGSYVQGTGVFTVASGDPAADGVAVGDFAALDTGGATAAFIARVTARTSTTITLSTTVKSGTNPANGTYTLRIGGAWLGPNAAVSFPFGFVQTTMVNANSDRPRVNFKNDQTYSVTASMSHNSTTGPTTFQGYTTSYGDLGKATFDGGTSGASYVLLTATSSAYCRWLDLIFTNNGATGNANGVTATGVGHEWRRCVFHDFLGNGFTSPPASDIVECEAYACNKSNSSSSGGFNTTQTSSVYKRCYSHDNAGSNAHGFYANPAGAGITYVDCISENNGSHGFGFQQSGTCSFVNCVAWNNGKDGIHAVVGNCSIHMENCILGLNAAGYGFRGVDVTSGYAVMRKCAFYSNTSGETTVINPSLEEGSITLSADPFVDAANGDFRLNSTAGGGAACRNAGIGLFNQTSPAAGTIAYPDIGAVQHQDAGGSAGPVARPVVIQNIGTY